MPQIVFKKKENDGDGSHSKLKGSHVKDGTQTFNKLSLIQSQGSRTSTQCAVGSIKQQNNRSRSLLEEQQLKHRINSSQANKRFKDFRLFKESTQQNDDRMNTTFDNRIGGGMMTMMGSRYQQLDYYDHLQNHLIDNELNSSTTQGFQQKTLELNSNQKQMDENLNRLVLYNSMRMQKGERDKRVYTLLKHGINQVRDIKYNKTPIEGSEMRESLEKYSNSLKPFYRQPDIVKITEDQLKNTNTSLMNGSATFSSFKFPQHKSSLQHGINHRAVSNQTGKRTNLIRKSDYADDSSVVNDHGFPHDSAVGDHLLNKSLDNIEEIINRRVSTAQGINGGGRNQNNGNDILILKKKFEDSESNIIHELYTQHFAHKNKELQQQTIMGQKILEVDNQSQITLAKTQHTRAQQPPRLDTSSLALTNHNIISPSNFNETEFEKVKYVQYIPKHQNGSAEQSINQVYLNQQPKPFFIDQSTFHQMNMLQAQKRCHSMHKHSKQCVNNEEFDAAKLQNMAFKNLIVQDPLQKQQLINMKNNARINQSMTESVKASFFPTCQMPVELEQVLKETQDFQKTLLLGDKRPQTGQNAQSRFFKTKSGGEDVNQHVTVVHKDNNLINEEFVDSDINQGTTNNKKRNERRNFEETYDSNKLDPEFLQQQLSQPDVIITSSQPTFQHPSSLSASQQHNRNYYFPKVSILNYFSGISQDSQPLIAPLTNGNLDYSLTPISQQNLKINIDKECTKYHQQRVQQQQFSSGSSDNHNSPTQPNKNELTQNIFRPRNLYNVGSSVITSPDAQTANELLNADDNAGKDKKFFNFREVNRLQNQKKWKSPFVHQKECDFNKKIHLKSNEYQNFEKSFKVNHSLSLNTSINNPYILWQKNKEYGNYQTRKRKSLQQQTVMRDNYTSQVQKFTNLVKQTYHSSNNQNQRKNKRDSTGSVEKNHNNEKSVIYSSNKANNFSGQQQNDQQSLLTKQVKYYKRPFTQQHQRLKHQKAAQINTFSQDSHFQNNNHVNGNIRFETESMSMSSGNINVTVHQQSVHSLKKKAGQHASDHSHSAAHKSGKRLIISKRSDQNFSKSKSKSRMNNDSGTLVFNSGAIENPIEQNQEEKNNDNEIVYSDEQLPCNENE